MMIRHLATTGTFLSLALLPLSAQAYVTPDEGLNDDTLTTRFYEEPPSIRDLEDIQKQQQLTSAQRREAELKAVMPQPEPAPTEDMHNAAPEQPQSDLDKMIQLIQLLQSNQTSSQGSQEDARAGLDPVSQRLLIRAEAQAAAAERAALIESLTGQNSETLHSGAPLTDSGPATVLTVLALALAGAETWRRARKTEQAM